MSKSIVLATEPNHFSDDQIKDYRLETLRAFNFFVNDDGDIVKMDSLEPAPPSIKEVVHDSRGNFIALRHLIKLIKILEDTLTLFVVEGVHNLFIRNIPTLAESTHLRGTLSFLVTEYIDDKQIKLASVEESRKLSEKIFIEQVVPVIVPFLAETKIELSDKEKEYLEKKGVDIGYKAILEKAKHLAKKEAWGQEVSLSKDSTGHGYALPAIKCLISFENEKEFLGRLDSKEQGQSIIEFAIRYRDHINRTILHYAAAKDKADIVEKLCTFEKISEQLYQGDNYGRTPLHIATSQGYVATVEKLATIQNDLNAKDEHGKTPLHIAVISDQAEVVLILLNNKKVKLNAVDKDGNTVLHLAAKHGSLQVLEVLIDSGKFNDTINVQNLHGTTPLHHSVFWKHIDVAAKLIELGADLNVEDNKCKTPLYTALEGDFMEIFQVLWKKGAELIVNNDKTPKKPLDVNIFVKYVNWDYSLFVSSAWQKKSFAKPIITKQKISQDIVDFIDDFYSFLKDNSEIIKPLTRNEQDHISLISKIIESKDVGIIKNFIIEFPELLKVLDSKQKEKVLDQVKDWPQIEELLQPYVGYAQKLLDVLLSAKELKNFENQDSNKFFESFVKKHEDIKFPIDKGQREEIICSLVLNAAIIFENKEVVGKILSTNHGNIFRYLDGTEYSPISNALSCGNEEILDMIINYVREYSQTSEFNKCTMHKEEEKNVLELLKFPQCNSLSAHDCYQKLLTPVYDSDALLPSGAISEVVTQMEIFN